MTAHMKKEKPTEYPTEVAVEAIWCALVSRPIATSRLLHRAKKTCHKVELHRVGFESSHATPSHLDPTFTTTQVSTRGTPMNAGRCTSGDGTISISSIWVVLDRLFSPGGFQLLREERRKRKIIRGEDVDATQCVRPWLSICMRCMHAFPALYKRPNLERSKRWPKKAPSTRNREKHVENDPSLCVKYACTHPSGSRRTNTTVPCPTVPELVENKHNSVSRATGTHLMGVNKTKGAPMHARVSN